MGIEKLDFSAHVPVNVARLGALRLTKLRFIPSPVSFSFYVARKVKLVLFIWTQPPSKSSPVH